MFEIKRKPRERGLSIIIVGCGKVGATLIERLVKENHDITVIDEDPELVQTMTGLYDIYGVVGNGASYSTQMEAGVDQADLLIAVTGSDELNLLCCVIAKQAGKCDVIARVRTPDYSEDAPYLKSKLELAMIINPEQEAAREITRILYLPTAIGVSAFARGQAELIHIKVPQGNMLHGKQIRQLSQELSGAVLICAAEREGEVYIPDGAFEIHEGDVLSFISPSRDAKTFLKKIGFQTHQVKDTMIIGGGKAAFYLARKLISAGIDVKIIEKNRKRCEELSTLLPRAVVINADGTDAELLKEAGIMRAESFVSLTGIDEENILVSLHVKGISKAKVVTKINRIAFNQVIDNLDLGSVIYPKYIAAEAILAFVRAKSASKNSNIETMVQLFDNRVEAIEFKIERNSGVTDIPLKQMKLKDNLLVACINREGTILIPGGNDEILVGDSVIIVTTHTGFKNIQDILR